MSKVILNIISNFIGKFYIAIIAIVMVPVYIKYLGIESYGLVGFYTTLVSTFAILDLGLSTALNREVAKSAHTIVTSELCNLVFSLEIVYWLVGGLICIIIFLLSGVISTYWLKVENIDINILQRSIFLMGLIIAFQWPISLYNGGLMGMEKQVALNTIAVIMMTLRAVGVLGILIFISNSIEAFFLWQVIVNLLHVLIVRYAMWKFLRTSKLKKQFSLTALKKIWRFAAGLTTTGIATFFLIQADKILLSKMLPLEDFAYYTMAFTVASSLNNFTSPISTAIFPKLSTLAASGQTESLKKIYHFACRLTATVIFPVSLTLVLFAPEVLMVWLKNTQTVLHTTFLLRVLVIATMLNTLTMTPYLLTLAFGWTKLGFYQNLIAAIIVVPLLYWSTKQYGAPGAAFVWLCINIGIVLFSIPIIHRKIFNGSILKWYLNDNLIPFLFAVLGSCSIYLAYKTLFPSYQFSYFTIVVLFGAVCAVSIIQFPNLISYVKKFFRINNKAHAN